MVKFEISRQAAFTLVAVCMIVFLVLTTSGDFSLNWGGHDAVQ